MDKMKRIIAYIIVIAFAVNSAGQGYMHRAESRDALRPVSTGNFIGKGIIQLDPVCWHLEKYLLRRGQETIHPDATSRDIPQIIFRFFDQYGSMIDHHISRCRNSKIFLPKDTEVAILDSKEFNLIFNVFDLLFNNAIIYSKKGDDRPEIVIRITTSLSGSLIMEIQDQGIGIAADDIDKIMSLDKGPYKAPNAVEHYPEGRGVGFSMAHRIVANMLQGKLTLKSSIKKGTTVTVVIPNVVKNMLTDIAPSIPRNDLPKDFELGPIAPRGTSAQALEAIASAA